MEAKQKNILIFCGGLISGFGLTALYFKATKQSGMEGLKDEMNEIKAARATSNGGLRPSCLKCVIKHISQAQTLMAETKKGYPKHLYYAIGHLGEAEDESVKKYPELANKIRDARELLFAGKDVDLDSLIDLVENIHNK